MHRNAAHIAGLTKLLRIYNHTNTGWPGLKLKLATHVVLPQKLWVLNEQQQAFAWVVRLGQNIIIHIRLLHMDPGGNDYCSIDPHQHTGVTQMRAVYSSVSRLHITTAIIFRILEFKKDYWKQLIENGDTLQSDEPSSSIIKTLCQCKAL